MKKIILPIIAILFLFVFPKNTYAVADYEGCGDKWRADRYTCSETYKSCYETCGKAEGVADTGCYKACDNTNKSCEEKASANYNSCLESSKKPTSAPASSPAQAEPVNCWDIMQDNTCLRNFTKCNINCPSTGDQRQRTCQDVCNKTSKACSEEQTANYKACVNANTQAQQQSATKELQPSKNPSTSGSPKPDQFKTWMGDKIPVFIGEWFQAVVTGMMMQEFAYEMSKFSDEALFGRDEREIEEEEKAKAERRKQEWEQKEKQAQVDFEELMNRAPLLTDEELASIKRNSQNTAVPSGNSNSPYSLDILRGEAQIKLPGQNQWKALKAGDKITPGSTIFTGMDTTTVLSIKGKGVVQVQSFTEIKIDEKGLEQASKTGQTYTDIKLDKGEIEVNVDSGVFTAPILQVHTLNATTSVRGTHFWVNYDEDKRLAVVGVYEGKVEFKTKNGKTFMISPDGERPGIMVFSQKFSIAKLAITGLVLVVVIGGVALFLKRKSIKALGSKKKSSR